MTKHERNLVGTEPAAPPLPRLLKPRTLAEEWDCSPSKIYKLIQRENDSPGKGLKSVLIDGMVRVRREDVEAYEELCAKNSGSGSTGENSSPSADAARASSEALSASKRDRIAKRKPS